MIGKFIGHADVRLLKDSGNDRLVQLLVDFSFEDKNGKLWTAPTGSISDGASVPWLFQPIIGDPLVGRYRRSALIHDVYCKTQLEPSHTVHTLFAEMMEVDGVPPIKRKLMAIAVARFGPSWDVPLES